MEEVVTLIRDNRIGYLAKYFKYVVVNGVVASPFAVSHAVGNTFYNVYRAMYKYVPGLLKSSFFQTFHATFANLAMKTW